ncbi:hypothetical protein Dimus_005940 [Dionaea muscipula]
MTCSFSIRPETRHRGGAAMGYAKRQASPAMRHRGGGAESGSDDGINLELRRTRSTTTSARFGPNQSRCCRNRHG